MDTFFFKWSFLLICNFSKSGDLNKEKVIDALIVLVFESTKVTQKGLVCHILKERSSYLQYFVTYGHLNSVPKISKPLFDKF